MGWSQLKRLVIVYAAGFLIAHGENARKPVEKPTLSRVEMKTLPDLNLKLTVLNRFAPRWYILTITKGSEVQTFHLESSSLSQMLTLADTGLWVNVPAPPGHKKAAYTKTLCPLWGSKDKAAFDLLSFDMKKPTNPYYSLCDGRVYLRLQLSSETKLSLTEWGTDLLRHAHFGEDVVNGFKPYLVALEAEAPNKELAKRLDKAERVGFPLNGETQAVEGSDAVNKENQLGVELINPEPFLRYGMWYRTKMHDDVFVSLHLAGLIPTEIRNSFRDRVFPLYGDELSSLVYIIAYDLRHYTAEFVLGTDQPPVNREEAVWGSGVDLRKPVVTIGSIPPYALSDAAAVFIGGFKEKHSTIKVGTHNGKTYGHTQGGIELQPLEPGLATLMNDKNGKVQILEWPEGAAAEKLKKNMVSARQNGLMVVDHGEPSIYVNKWREGNWSADARGVRTSLRSAVCLQEFRDQQFLIFMAFTSATPSSIARMMQAYHCQSGLHLDMNAHMYTHNALFRFDDKQQLEIQYLNKQMLYPQGLTRHRYIMDNNYRDFFFVRKKGNL